MLLAVVKHARQQHAHRLQLIQIANPATDDCRIANFDVDSLDGALIATPKGRIFGGNVNAKREANRRHAQQYPDDPERIGERVSLAGRCHTASLATEVGDRLLARRKRRRISGRAR